MSLCSSIQKRWVTIALILLIVAACFVVLGTDRESAYAAGASGSSSGIGELLLPDYDTAASGKKVFDGEQFWRLVDALCSKTEDKSNIAGLSAKDAQAIRTANGGDDVVVTIDGKQWMVTDLRKADNGHVIATMWLATSAQTSSWNKWAENTPTYDYPSNMYSTSYIRASALNSGGCGYVATKGATTLTTIAQSATHEYAKFTMAAVQDGSRQLSLTKYIVQPKNVAYQSSETMRTYDKNWYTCPNEAWGTPDSVRYNNANMNYSSKTHYAQWSSDYLWLPSLAETGYSGITGIWNLSDSQRGNATNSWLRTGDSVNADSVYYLNASGGANFKDTATAYAVRPAFHLDLTQAATDATQPIDLPTTGDNPTDRSKAYNAADQTFTLQDFDASKMQATVAGKDPNGVAIDAASCSFDATTGQIHAKFAGTYTVEFTLKDADNTFWWDDTAGTDPRTLTVTITPKQLTLALSNDVPDGKWEWTLGGAYKATLTASDIETGDTIGLHAFYTADTGGATQDIVATQTGTQTVAEIDLSVIPIGAYKLTAALDNSVGESINYSIQNGLNAAGMPRAFAVLSKKVDTSDIAWQYTALGSSGNPIPGGANQADIANGARIVFAYFGTRDSYGAVTNKPEIKRDTLPKDGEGNLLVEIDNVTSSFNGTTYADGYSNQSGSAVAHYTTKVLLKIVHDDYLFANDQKQYELSLNWEIVKGEFDLSNVQWKYKYTTSTGTVSNVYDPDTTKLEYNDGSVIKVEIDPTTLPLGLSAPGGIFDYQNASGIEVKTYAATVAGDTLDYDDACFEQPADLVLNWEILGKGIAVKWKPVQSGTYYLKELNCDPKYTIGDSKIVHYKYFAPDGSLLGIDEAGRQAIADKVIADNIGPENPQTFTIEAYLDGNNSGNYRLLADPARTTVSIGNDPYTAVEAQVPETATYDGNAHYTQDEVKISGAPVGANGYTITYYAGTDVTDMSKNTKLDGAPKDAGKYVIAIEMTDESYLLDKSVFAVEILPKQVAVPTVKAVSFTGAEYDLLDLMSGYDAALMTMDLVTTATAAGTYRAMLTLNSANYVWATADGATGSQEYALEWSIAKAQLTEIWNKDGDGKPTLSISSKYADYVQIVYEYCDADGNVVAESDLVAGQTYKVVAKLSAASAENFEFVDVNGDVSTTPSQSGTQTFTFGNDAANPDAPGNNGNATLGGVSEPWFKIVMIAMLGVMVMIMLLLFMIWIAVIGIRNLRKDRKRGA